MIILWFWGIFCSVAANDATLRQDGADDHCNRTVDIYQSVSSPPVTEQNRGRPLACTYRIRVRPARSDWVVFVRFLRFRVGAPDAARGRCEGGRVRIVDGRSDSGRSNGGAPGEFCGEIDAPKTFASETPWVEVELFVEKYGPETFLQFTATVEQQQEVHARYGQYSQLYPNRRGTLVPGSYCDRTFHGCAPTRCFVQSPGFPGIYPRNLRCRYSLTVSRSVVALDLTAFDVDGLRCDNMLLCFPRPLTKDPSDCPFDHVRVYDGPTEDHPLIVTLCGRGRLKSQIVASGSEVLVEFVTSPAGPLLNTGFHFKAEAAHAEAETEHEHPRFDPSNGTCSVERRLRPGDVLTFGHLRSWYPANTTCTYKFLASEDEVLKLSFDFFRVERVTRCQESLKVYDASGPEPAAILSKLCDVNRPRTEHPRQMYETSGPALFLEFVGAVGSLEGSSISYAFEVKSVNVVARRNALSPCTRQFSPETSGLSGLFAGHSLPDAVNSSSLTCNYSFDASSMEQGRVRLKILTSLRRTRSCAECWQEPLFAEVKLGVGERVCFCKISTHKSHTIVSLGPHLHLSTYAESSLDKRLPHRHLVNGSYLFFPESRCGTEKRELDIQGSIVLPPTTPGSCPDGPPCPADDSIFCRWWIPVFYRMDLLLKLDGLPDNANCTDDHATVANIVVCPSGREQEVLLHREDIRDLQAEVRLRLSHLQASVNFSVHWTQLRVLPPPGALREPLMTLGRDCDFLCAGAMACLTGDLVCNGVGNCPGPGAGADEEVALCLLPGGEIKVYWWMWASLVAGVIMCVILAVATCRRIRRACLMGAA